MTTLFVSGRIIDLILALTMLEAIVVVTYRRRTGRGVRSGDLAANLLAGVCLLLALRCALTGASWPWVALWLFASLVAHVADLRRRWT